MHWMAGFVNTSFTVTLNLNQFTTAHNKSSAEYVNAEDALYSCSRSTTDSCSDDCLQDNSSARTPWKIFFFCCSKMRVYWPIA
jgi:hypothetical protein